MNYQDLFNQIDIIRDEVQASAGVPMTMGMDFGKPGSDKTAVGMMMMMGTPTRPTPSVFTPPVQKSGINKYGPKPESTKYLVWSIAFGLRFEEDKGQFMPGTYKRTEGIDMATNLKVHFWFMRIRKKDARGRNTVLDWVEVSRAQLPKQLFTEALLLDIHL